MSLCFSVFLAFLAPLPCAAQGRAHFLAHAENIRFSYGFCKDSMERPSASSGSSNSLMSSGLGPHRRNVRFCKVLKDFGLTIRF